MPSLKEILEGNRSCFTPIMDRSLDNAHVELLDFSEANHDLKNIDLTDTPVFNAYISDLLDNGAKTGVGGYSENRVIYRNRNNFAGREARSIHLGIDLWTVPFVNIYAPLEARVHSFANNKGFGNYGPTIILEHRLQNTVFHTLYGHLTLKSLEGLREGKIFGKGEKIGQIGDFPENGDWPPHLHFQVIENMTGYQGDYPGVVAFSEKEKYLNNSCDPNLILGIEKLLSHTKPLSQEGAGDSGGHKAGNGSR